MLLADRGYNSVIGENDIADFLDIAHISCAHFANKNFMSGAKLLSDCFNNTHRRIIAFGSHQHIVFCFKSR